MNNFIKRALQAIVITCGVWFSPEWWEKGLASPWGDVKISPDGCTRVQAFKPFWLLPDILHREFPPNEEGRATWFPIWEAPGFYRLYNNETGQVMGETVVYDLAFSGGRIVWDQEGEVYMGMIYLGPSLKIALLANRDLDDEYVSSESVTSQGRSGPTSHAEILR